MGTHYRSLKSFSFLGYVTAALVFAASAQTSETPLQLVKAIAERQSVLLKQEVTHPAYPRSARVAFDMSVFEKLQRQLTSAQLAQYPRMIVRPFSDVTITLEVRESALDTKDPARRSFSGWVVGENATSTSGQYSGTFGLTVKDGVVEGTISVGGISYLVQNSSSEGQIIRLFDGSKLRGGEPLPAPVVPQKRGAIGGDTLPSQSASTAEPAIVDVLVAFTNAAKNSAGGEPTIRKNINTAIGITNHAYVESGVNLKLRLAGALETSYVESGDTSLDSDQAALGNQNTQSLADARQMRDQIGADLVSLWIQYPVSPFCGVGYQPASVAQLTPALGYSTMVHSSYGGGSLCFSHELGHNMGLAHDLAVNPAQPVYPYGYGFVSLSSTPRFRTVMAYADSCGMQGCPIEALFSNPSITRYGVAAGNNTSNESLALNNAAPIVSAYRSPGPLKDIRVGSADSNPTLLTAIGSTVYFVADDGVNGAELWKSDGSKDGTVLVKDIRTGANGSAPLDLFNYNGTLFFNAIDATSGRELWKSDGTDAGTTLVKDLRPGGGNSFPTTFAAANGSLFFSASTGNFGFTLWKTDGTPSGTVLVKEYQIGGHSFWPQNLVGTPNYLYFRSASPTSETDIEIWSSDGTSAGTSVLKDINVGTGGSNPANLTAVGNSVFFTADNGINGRELWKSDGSAATTTMVADIQPGVESSAPSNLVAVGGTLYFTADDGANGRELWKSDGSSATLVKDIRPGALGSTPTNLMNVGGMLYFVADNGINGAELWKSDGTSAGTVLVKDIAAGGASSSPRSLVAHSSDLYFLADDGINGTKLWKSNGTANGTFALNSPGLSSNLAFATNLVVAGNQLFYTATDGATGRELYALPLPANSTIPSPFSFLMRNNVSLLSEQVSEPITVSGVEGSVPLAVEGGQFSIGCTASYFLFPTTIANGQTVCVRHTSASVSNGVTNTTLTIGGISATFTTSTIGPKNLTVTKDGTGTGTVTSVPAGISCGGVCNKEFSANTMVTLAANPSYGSALAGWSGSGCSGTGVCMVTMDVAKTVNATFSLSTTTVPAAPSSPAAVPGNASALITFASFSEPQAPITSYTVSCDMGMVTATGTASPIWVTGLTNGVPSTCVITAMNSVGTSAPSASVTVTPSASSPLTLVSVQSRKTHGATGIFDVTVDTAIVIGGLVTVEPRAIGAGHSIVFQFNAPITIAGTPAAVDTSAATIGSVSTSINGNEVTVTLTGMPDNRRATVSLDGVNGLVNNFPVSLGFLVGDVNNSRSVNASDISGVKARSGQATSSSNYKFDLNASGGINATDISAVKVRSGLVLP